MAYEVEPVKSISLGSYPIKNEYDFLDIISRVFTAFYNQLVEQEKLNQLLKNFLEKKKWVFEKKNTETKYGIPNRPLKHINQITLFDVPEGLEMIFHANYLTSELYGTFIMNSDKDNTVKISELEHIKRDIYYHKEVCRI